MKKKKNSGYYALYSPSRNLYFGLGGWQDFETVMIFPEWELEFHTVPDDGEWILIEEAREKENKNV